MGGVAAVDERVPVLTVECEERDGTYLRNVRFAPLSIERLKHLWERMKGYKILFGSPIETVDDFIGTFVRTDGSDVWTTSLIWEVDDVGIIYIDNMKSEYLQCDAHFVKTS